jgi:hypothetical protein
MSTIQTRIDRLRAAVDQLRQSAPRIAEVRVHLEADPLAGEVPGQRRLCEWSSTRLPVWEVYR